MNEKGYCRSRSESLSKDLLRGFSDMINLLLLERLLITVPSGRRCLFVDQLMEHWTKHSDQFILEEEKNCEKILSEPVVDETQWGFVGDLDRLSEIRRTLSSGRDMATKILEITLNNMLNNIEKTETEKTQKKENDNE
jgi:hypothetical protein